MLAEIRFKTKTYNVHRNVYSNVHRNVYSNVHRNVYSNVHQHDLVFWSSITEVSSCFVRLDFFMLVRYFHYTFLAYFLTPLG